MALWEEKGGTLHLLWLGRRILETTVEMIKQRATANVAGTNFMGDEYAERDVGMVA